MGRCEDRRPGLRSSWRYRLGLESLEDRTLLTAGVREEFMLELVNRMRTDPAGELSRLLNSNDPNVASALNFFNVDQTLLAQQWSTLAPAPPLDFNDALTTAALSHSELMSQDDQQSHQLPGEPDFGTRDQNAGYTAASGGENVYAFALETFDAYAGFAIDWGNGPGGMQSPPGHRQNMMDSSFRDIGIGLVDGGGSGKTTGPLLVTQDFGAPSNPGNPFLVGAVFTGTNADPYYSLSGEGTTQVTSNGLPNVSVRATSVSDPAIAFTTTTTAAGGYQVQLPAGTYTVTFSGGALVSNVVKTVSVTTNNVLLNIDTHQQSVLPTSSVAALPATSPASFTVSWSGSDAGGPGIAAYDVLVSDNGSPFTPFVTATSATSATFSGVNGHTYGFYSVATDTVGNQQPSPIAAQATTVVADQQANAEFVTAVYHDVLARTPDAGGLAYWTQLLNSGTAVSGVAEAIAHSDEYYANFVIRPAYSKLLDRIADAGGVTFWTTQMDAGTTDQELEADLVSAGGTNGEFYQSAGGTNTLWIDAVYKLLLGRTADANGENFWNSKLAAGATLNEVAQGIAGSQENNTQIINEDYFHYLGRAADSGGLDFWLGQFAAGKTNEDVIAGFTGSAEYYTEHTS